MGKLKQGCTNSLGRLKCIGGETCQPHTEEEEGGEANILNFFFNVISFYCIG
jgi:hypothetical protein